MAPARGIRATGLEVIGGVETAVVSFSAMVGGSPIWFRVWVDEEALVHQAKMVARGHFMDHRYLDFDAPLTVEAPLDASVANP